MAETLKNIRIFLSSPSDVQGERATVFKIAEELNAGMSNALKRRLEIVGWEDVNASISSYAQNAINEQIGDYDIFLGILSIRFGTPTPKAGSGTEEEFEIAYQNFKNRKLADICLFFKTDGFTTYDINIEQFNLVNEFKQKVSGLGCYRIDFKENVFENLIRKLLTNILLDWENYEKRIEVIETKPIEMQIDDIDDDMGYYDAIYKSIDELNESTLINTMIVDACREFNQKINITTEKLTKCLNDKQKTNTINDFSADMDLFSDKLNNSIINQMTHLINAMNYFELSSKIYVEDFSEPLTELHNLISIFNRNISAFTDSLGTIEYLSDIINKSPRTTTKFNKSKKSLLLVLDKFYEHQSNSIRLLEDSKSKLSQLIEEGRR